MKTAKQQQQTNKQNKKLLQAKYCIAMKIIYSN